MPLPPRSAPLPVAAGRGRRPGGAAGLAGSTEYGLMSQSYMDVAAVAPDQVREEREDDPPPPPPLAERIRGPALSLTLPPPIPLITLSLYQPVISPRYKGEEEEEDGAGVTSGRPVAREEACHAAGGGGGLGARAPPAALAPPQTPADADAALAAAATAALALDEAPATATATAIAPHHRHHRMPPLGAARQCHENEVAEVVIVCEPEGTSLMMGGLHPR